MVQNGVQIGNGMIYIDEGHLYIVMHGGSLPIVIKNISSDMLEQIGDFLSFRGKNPDKAANRIDFDDLSIRFIKSELYFISEKLNLIFSQISLSQLKKAGTFLRKSK